MAEIRSEVTVNYNFDLEDDDFFAENFWSISENDLLTSTAFPRVVNQEPTIQPEGNAKLIDTNQQTATASLLDCTIKDNKKDDLDKSKKVPSNTPIEPRKQDKQLPFLSPLQDLGKDSLNINSRFTPGFTPKAKKRKFPGPAGVYSQNKLQVLPCDLEKTSTENLEEDLEVQDITSSQFTADDLLLPSWQNLQKDVSSCQTLLSTAKYHSIHRVLNETSKKKLPKHVVVPVLCVLIKKFKHEDSSLLLIDDTGEISGKIYKDVLDEYKEDIKVGTALILRKVTSLCNVLLLKKPCMASIYLEDGSVKHIHELSSLLDKGEPLKQMGCECPGTPKENENGVDAILKMCDASLNAKATSSRSSLSKNVAGCSTSHVNTNAPNLSKQRNANFNSPHNTWQFANVPGTAASNKDSSRSIPSAGQNISNVLLPKSTSKEENINTLCITSKASGSAVSGNVNIVDSMPIPIKISRESDDLFCDGLEMDEFDELLCSLDEKSFLEEI